MKRLLKPLFVLVLILFTQQIIFAQDAEKTVEIVVSGSAKTQDEAKQLALRSAIEQAFGVFISSKTEILNDNLVSDQITSISNGNIKSYQVLNESQLPDGSWGVTLKSIVSIDKLTSFVQAKGVEVEIKGGLFALNIKQQILNEQAEVKAMNEMVGILHEQMQISFDYTIKSGEPQSIDSENKNWEIPLVVSVTTNKNFDFCSNFCVKTLTALSLSPQEVESYQSLNKNVFPIFLNFNGVENVFYLRKESSLKTFISSIDRWDFYTRLFTVNSGFNEFIENEDYFPNHQIVTANSNQLYKEVINFPTSDKVVATISWQSKHTLREIEKINRYIVNPRGIISYYKHGGFVIFEENGQGLVVSISDLGGEMKWNEADLICRDLISGYFDWYLPSIEELSVIYKKFGKEFLDGKIYWSSTSIGNIIPIPHYTFSFFNGTIDKHSPLGRMNVRAVRVFSNVTHKSNDYWKDLPHPVSWVNDLENILTIQEIKSLDSLISEYEKITTNEIAIISIPTSATEKDQFEDLSLHIAKKWGIGKKEKNNGILIAVSKGHRFIRIQNGLGIEQVLSDSQTKQIIDQIIIPSFKVNEYYKGLFNGIIEIIKVLENSSKK